MNEFTMAWAAGFFDGEGCAVITQTPTGYGIAVSVANNNKEAIDFFNKNWGGRVKMVTIEDWREKYHRKANHDSYRVEFDHAEAQRLLLDLYPHLVTRRREVEVLLQALAVLPKQEPTSGSRFPKKIPPGSSHILVPFYKELRNIRNS